MKVAIVGGGIVGLSAARFLSARGHKTTLFEQYPLFGDRGSSHGRSRIVRKAYPDAFYTECMEQAYPMWADLEAASGRRLIHEVGLLYMGSRHSSTLQRVLAGLTDLNVEHAILGPNKANATLPGLRLNNDEIGILTPEAGWVNAEGALRATRDLAIADGLTLTQFTVTDVLELESKYDAFVIAPGAWISDFVQAPVRVTLQTFGYAQLQIGGPVWIDDSDLAYGFPSDELGQKIGLHTPGPEIDPNSPTREPDPAAMAVLTRKTQDRFGVEAPIEHWKTCLYTSTPSEDFLLGRIASNGFFASACSGHGFKMGPWIGKLLADFVEGKDKPGNHPRFHFAGS